MNRHIPDKECRVSKLGTVPKDWIDTSFNELFEEIVEVTNETDVFPLYSLTIENGVTPKTARYERSFLITKDDESYKLVAKDEFVYNPMNLRFGALARLRDDIKVSVSGYYNIFRNKSEYSPAFLEYFLKSERMMYLYNSYATGSLIEKQRVHFSKFIDFKVPLPPVEEANKIANILLNWDKAIELKEQLIEQKIEKKKGLMQKLLTGKVRLPGFEEEWDEAPLGKIAEVIMGQSPPSESYNDSQKGFPLIQGNADCKNRKTSPRIWTSQPSKICRIGDIIMTVRAPVGYISRSIHDACIGRGVCAIRGTINQDYLYYQMQFKEDHWVRISQGSTFDSVNSSDIKGLIVFVPSEEEQKVIAKVLTLCDDEIGFLERELQEVMKQKMGLMQLLLTGKVRVKV